MKLKNKKVIFVGASPILQGKKLGKWIDSFDVVIRTNGSKVMSPTLYEDYGSRTDVCYFNVQHTREYHPFPINKMKKQGIKELVFKTVNDNIKDFYEKKGFKVRTLLPLVKELNDRIKGLLMGCVIFTDIIGECPKEFWITGIDFYINKPKVFIPGDYREYYEGYLGDKIEKKANVQNVGRLDPHCQWSNTNYIYGLYKRGKFKTHDFIEDIMLEIVNHPEKYKFENKFKDLLENGN